MSKQSYTNPGLPSNLYSGAAVRIDTRPFANMLYQEQKYQEAKRQKEGEDLDNEMKSNVAKIRDADVPDYVNAYQNYASVTKALMNDSKLKRDPQAYAQAQIARGKLYASAQGLANQSKSLRDNFEQLDKDRFVNGDRYSDDYFAKRSAANKLPISKLQGVDLGQRDEKGNSVLVDLTNPDNYLYKDQYDPTKLLNTARGEKLTNEVDEGAIDKTGLQNKITTYQFYGNKPNEFKNVILQGMMGDRHAQRFFTSQLKNTSPEEIAKVNEQYNAIPESVWKQMGINKEELKVEHPDNQADVAATYLAQKHAIENIPRAIKTDLKTNEAVKMRLNQAFDLTKLNIEHQNRLTEKKAKEGGGQVQGNDIIDSLFEDAKNNPADYFPKEGGKKTLYQANVSPQFKQMLAFKDDKGKLVYPDVVRFSEDGKYIYPLVFEGNAVNGKRQVKEVNSQPVLTDEIRARMGKTLFGVKGAAAIMNGQKGKSGKSTPAKEANYDDLINHYSK